VAAINCERRIGCIPTLGICFSIDGGVPGMRAV
jgi:hypothetical protein